MAELRDTHQPSFVLWPLQNARTAYAPVYLPVVFVVPHRRFKDGQPVPDSQVSNVCFRIEKAPGRAKVAGYQYRGILVPQLERFRYEVSDLELANYKIIVSSQVFFRYAPNDPNNVDGYINIDYADAVDGDFFQYTTERGTLTDKIRYIPHADYYDISPVSLSTAELQPLGKYVFSWCANYYRRVITPTNELSCIDTSIDRLARTSVVFDHPGDIHQEMFEKTPSFIFDSTQLPLAEEPTFRFYRPFADALNDLFDESSFLETINHIDHIQASMIPYLAYLLGWDMRYSSRTTDDTRRRALKNARRLQSLKGSRRAIRDLFDIFQYSVELVNLWYKPDGSGFVGPYDSTKDEWQISSDIVCRTDPLLIDYSTNGYGQIDLPLLFRPDGNMTVEAWIVKTSSPLYQSLKDTLDYSILENDNKCSVDNNGFQVNTLLHTALTAGSVIGYSRVLVNQTTNSGGSIENVGYGPLNMLGIKYDQYFNRFNITFDRYLQFEADEKLFIAVTYNREKINIPPAMADFKANRFDIKIIERAVPGEYFEQPDPQSLEFLINLVFQLKAFHSLLRKIIFTVNLIDVYTVTDICVGGQNAQRQGTLFGELQVPPAVIPLDIENSGIPCGDDTVNRNFKDSDLLYRNTILRGIESEFLAWKELDGKYDIENRALYESLSRVQIPTDPSSETCQWTERGQDRRFAADIDVDQETDIRSTACDVTTTTEDYCYKGRVSDTQSLTSIIAADETYVDSPCLTQGNGFYYTIPYVHESWCQDGTGCITPDEKSSLRRSLLERLLARVLAFPNASLKYTDQQYLSEDQIDNKSQWAILRPSLNIVKDNLFIPGHRQITGNKLTSDFTHPTYNLRPWDDQLYPKCITSTTPSMAVTLNESTDGVEILVFDEGLPLTYIGNNLTPDVISYGDHGSTTIELVTHKVFTSTPKREYVELEGVVYAEDVSTSAPDSICLSSQIGKIFDSAADSGLGIDPGTGSGTDIPVPIDNGWALDFSEDTVSGSRYSFISTDGDSSGNIYSISALSTDDQINVIRKYDSDGVVVWEETIEYADYWTASFPVDPRTSLRAARIVTASDGLYTIHEFGIRKHDLNGNMLWESFHDEFAYTIAPFTITWVERVGGVADPTNNRFYTTALWYNAPSAPSDRIVLSAYDATTGSLVNDVVISVSGALDSYTQSTLKLDSSGSIIISINYENPASNINSVIAKYDSSLSLVWSHTILQSQYNNTNQAATSIGIDGSDNVYVKTAYGLTKIDSSGNVVWAYETGGFAYAVWGMDVTPSGDIFLADTGNPDVLDVVKIDTNGVEQWAYEISVPAGDTLSYIYSMLNASSICRIANNTLLLPSSRYSNSASAYVEVLFKLPLVHTVGTFGDYTFTDITGTLILTSIAATDGGATLNSDSITNTFTSTTPTLLDPGISNTTSLTVINP